MSHHPAPIRRALGKLAERTSPERQTDTRTRQLALARASAAAQAQRLRLLALVGEPRSVSPPAVVADGAVVRVDLYDIHVDRKRFQNRDQAHSSESVDRIVEAVRKGTFSWGLFDPILLWRDPADNQLYVLSGHSRREAFTQLRDLLGLSEFATIPAKIVTVSEREAIALARNSNTLSTKETPAERASYYRNRRSEGISRKDLEAEAATNEGRNASVVLALSYLNPTGAALDLVRATQGSEVTGAQNALTLGTWLGEARRRHPDLSNAHETELFDWLKGGAYGTRAGQISTKPDFLNRVAALILKNTVWGTFEATAPLNPLGRAAKSDVEQEQDAAERDARRAVSDAESIFQEKLRDYTAREKDRAKLERVLAPYHTAIRAAQITLQQVIARRDTVKQALRTQTSLFGVGQKRPSRIPSPMLLRSEDYGVDLIDYREATASGLLITRKAGLGRTTTPDAVRVDIYQRITDKLVSIIETSGELPWQKRHNGQPARYANIPATNRHLNLSSRKAYSGINDFLLNLTNYVTGKNNRLWLTYKQAEALGGQVRKGSEGTAICFYTNDIMRNAQGKTMMRSKWEKLPKPQQAEWEPSWTIQGATVFSVDQIDGLEAVLGLLVENPPRSNTETIESCEAIVAGMPQRPPITADGGDRAYYSPTDDSVHTPLPGHFYEDAYYYGTLFHELIHSTGHSSRLNRKFGERSGDAGYSFEELIAELGAAYLCSEAGILHWRLKNSAAYLQFWQNRLIELLKEDKKFIFQAASSAQKAADFVLGVLPLSQLPAASVPVTTSVVATERPGPDRTRQLALARARANAQQQRLRLLALTT